jgi:hypothetical protein
MHAKRINLYSGKTRVECAAGAAVCIKVLELDWKRRRLFDAKCKSGKSKCK